MRPNVSAHGSAMHKLGSEDKRARMKMWVVAQMSFVYLKQPVLEKPKKIFKDVD